MALNPVNYSRIKYIRNYYYIVTSANRKPAPAARGLSLSCVGRPKGAKSAPGARWALRALDLGSIPARWALEANTRMAPGARWALGAEIKPVL